MLYGEFDMDKEYLVSDKAFKISSLAVQAMVYEVSCYPSPGLVSCISNGAHKDMDYYTFIDSTSVLIKYLTLCVQKGMETGRPEDIFMELKKLGVSAEKEMYEKTKGVNTHKGMIFLMGTCCGAVGIAVKHNMNFWEIEQIIKNMTKGITERELSPILRNKNFIKNGKLFGRKLSYGEKLFLKYNVKGVRGQVEQGLNLIFDFALGFYKKSKNLNENDRLVNTLIGIMQFSEDTNIIHRHSLDILKEVNAKAKHIIHLGGMRTDEGRKAIQLLDKEFIYRNISPGGTADLLAITVFLYLVKQYMSD